MPYPLPPPETIQRAAAQVAARSYYHLDTGKEIYPNWFVDLVSRSIVKALEWIGRMLGWVIRPLGAILEASPILGWLILTLLAVVAVSLLVHVVYTYVTVVRGERRKGGLYAAQLLDRQKPETWERLAREALERSDMIGAVRHLFRAGLLRLEAARRHPFHPAWTNQEYLRRYRHTPAHALLEPFVAVIDGKWYAGADCTAEDYARCAEAHSGLLAVAREMSHAQAA
ncbi:MAG: DUF4129 domain-containing protein [bacterium]|nr:DUF4129 domain-containing protein [bacterium]